ncbi:MAG: DUF983 domain-containing protein [Flavobacteriaceae bacterium TMED120]|nr:MAG: DUF983 domain-containing protein [Flavobacteriaceae bacterium TMED120]
MKSLLNIFRLKCPVCHKGEFLQTQPRFFFKLIRVRESCTNCKTRFKIEPSFYYGSMYVSYALGVFLMMATTLVYWLSSNPFSVLHCFLWIVGVVLILNSYINTWSKLIWANFFFKYNSKQEQSED